jgi:hypothetical protein
MEGVMDEEAKKVSEMSDEDLEARWAAGTPAKVRRDFVQTMHRVAEATVERSEDDLVTVEPVVLTASFGSFVTHSGLRTLPTATVGEPASAKAVSLSA